MAGSIFQIRRSGKELLKLSGTSYLIVYFKGYESYDEEV
jgi:hypothetical protein